MSETVKDDCIAEAEKWTARASNSAARVQSGYSDVAAPGEQLEAVFSGMAKAKVSGVVPLAPEVPGSTFEAFFACLKFLLLLSLRQPG